MRFIAILFGLALGAAALCIDASAPARADEGGGAAPAAVVVADDPAPVEPGSDAEAQEYALREAESPEVGEFVGGHHGLVFLVIVVGIFVLAYLFLKKEGKI